MKRGAISSYGTGFLFILEQPTGTELKERGIKQAEDNANALHEKWSEKAVEAFEIYLSLFCSGHTFKTEDVRDYAYKKKLVGEPLSQRAWGGIALRVKGKGLIVSNGTATVKNPKAHRANCTLWKKV